MPHLSRCEATGMGWRDELLAAAERLTEWAGDVPYEPLWRRCSECGVPYATDEGHRCPLDETP